MVMELDNYVNGDVYEGDFKEGKMHGWGYYKFKNGNEYHGNGKMIKWKEKESILQPQ